MPAGHRSTFVAPGHVRALTLAALSGGGGTRTSRPLAASCSRGRASRPSRPIAGDRAARRPGRYALRRRPRVDRAVSALSRHPEVPRPDVSAQRMAAVRGDASCGLTSAACSARCDAEVFLTADAESGRPPRGGDGAPTASTNTCRIFYAGARQTGRASPPAHPRGALVWTPRADVVPASPPSSRPCGASVLRFYHPFTAIACFLARCCSGRGSGRRDIPRTGRLLSRHHWWNLDPPLIGWRAAQPGRARGASWPDRDASVRSSIPVTRAVVFFVGAARRRSGSALDGRSRGRRSLALCRGTRSRERLLRRARPEPRCGHPHGRAAHPGGMPARTASSRCVRAGRIRPRHVRSAPPSRCA